MVDTIYVVERHDDGYHGPGRARYAQSLETALELASNERDEHRGESWRLNTDVGGDERVAFYPKDGASGWVVIDTDVVHE